jgi:hypothetical protein
LLIKGADDVSMWKNSLFVIIEILRILMLDSKCDVVGKLTRRWQMYRQRGYGFEFRYLNVSKARCDMQKSSAGNRLQWKSLNVIALGPGEIDK